MTISQHYKNITPPKEIKLLMVTEAPPLLADNYFYNLSDNDDSHGSSRSFFRGLMQGVGLLSIGISPYSESKLLDEFLANKYFLIDSCPIPLVDKQGKQLSNSKKKKIMVQYTESLYESIKSLEPEKILFVCSTNRIVVEKLKKYDYISDRLVTSSPLPYPGVGWLRRPDKKGFMDLLPEKYHLSPLY